MGPDAMIFVFWMLSFKPNFSLSSFTFIKRHFSSSSLSARRVVSSAYLRLLIFLPAILIPVCASSSPAFHMMYSQFSSVAQSCPTLCNSMNHSTPGLPVHHQLPDFTQTHAHRVGDAIELAMPSSHLILSCPLLLLPPIPPSIRVFLNESTLCMRWPKSWSFSFSISPSSEHPELISFRMDWLDLLAAIYSLDILLFLFGNSPLFHVQFELLLPDLLIGYSRCRSGGLVFPSLSEFSTVYCDPHSQRLWHSQ